MKPGAFDYAIKAPDREINLLLGSPDKPLGSKQAGTLQLEDTETSLNFRVNRLPKTSYALDMMALLRARSVVFGIIPFFLLAGLANSESEEEEEGNPGVFRHVIAAAVLTALVIQFRPPRGNPGAVNARSQDLAQDDDLGEWHSESLWTPTDNDVVIPKRRRKRWL